MPGGVLGVPGCFFEGGGWVIEQIDKIEQIEGLRNIEGSRFRFVEGFYLFAANNSFSSMMSSMPILI